MTRLARLLLCGAFAACAADETAHVARGGQCDASRQCMAELLCVDGICLDRPWRVVAPAAAKGGGACGALELSTAEVYQTVCTAAAARICESAVTRGTPRATEVAAMILSGMSATWFLGTFLMASTTRASTATS